jgi:hypothetical protein
MKEVKVLTPEEESKFKEFWKLNPRLSWNDAIKRFFTRKRE